LFDHNVEIWTSYRYVPLDNRESKVAMKRMHTVNAREEARISDGQLGNRRVQVLQFNQQVKALNVPWGLSLDHDERILWGPVLFETDLWRLGCLGRRCTNNRRPSSLVVITSRRLAVVRYSSVSQLGCFGWCRKPQVETVACVPLKWVLGFSINETFVNQKAAAAQCLSSFFCLPKVASEMNIRIMTNAGFGKAYLGPLTIKQRLLPRVQNPKCSFEDDKIVELRRWLGNLALFYYECEDNKRMALDLWRCDSKDGAPSRGWVPA